MKHTEIFYCYYKISILFMAHKMFLNICLIHMVNFECSYISYTYIHCSISVINIICYLCIALRWRHNGRADVSNHQPHDCLRKRLFGRRSKKTSKPASLASMQGIHWRPVNSTHKGPVMRKMFPFDDVIMVYEQNLNTVRYHDDTVNFLQIITIDTP